MGEDLDYQLSIRRQDLLHVFKFYHFVHAGLVDTVTTYLSLSLGFYELNPIVRNLFPEWSVLLPAVLVSLAYARGFAALVLFRSSSRIREAMLFSLYFPAAFNTANLVYFVLNNLYTLQVI